MSKLIQKNDSRATIRWKLLTGVSALALAVYVSSASVSVAEGAGQPQIWIELDGQYSQQSNGIETFAPNFLFSSPFDAASHLNLEKGPSTIWDEGAKISYEPDGSDWLFSLGVRYGKNRRDEVRDVRTKNPYDFFGLYLAYQNLATHSRESHTILDFQAGKDVGLGLLGSGGRSILSAGVRYAQFKSASNVAIQSQPSNVAAVYHPYDKFYASFAAARDFRGIGPSLSWDASATVAGNSATGHITFDWGLNGAILFARQRTQTQHKTSDMHVSHNGFQNTTHIPVYQRSVSSPPRSKNISVPNFGGFAALSMRYANAKISLGYRADFFSGAIDGGIDARKNENRGFFGPYASISVGIGD